MGAITPIAVFCEKCKGSLHKLRTGYGCSRLYLRKDALGMHRAVAATLPMARPVLGDDPDKPVCWMIGRSPKAWREIPLARKPRKNQRLVRKAGNKSLVVLLEPVEVIAHAK